MQQASLTAQRVRTAVLAGRDCRHGPSVPGVGPGDCRRGAEEAWREVSCGQVQGEATDCSSAICSHALQIKQLTQPETSVVAGVEGHQAPLCQGVLPVPTMYAALFLLGQVRSVSNNSMIVYIR